MKPYHANIEQDTLENTHFRKVEWTGAHMQVVLMSLLPGEDIGEEVHPHVDQFFRIEEGEGKAVVDGVEYELRDDFALVVPAGAAHNLFNTGEGTMKLYTIYTPANHIDGRVHATKADAEADEEDEAFGHSH